MWYNEPMKWLLRSPLHGLISGNMLLITVTGRKSGKQYTTPVSYLRNGNTLLVTSSHDRTWWRNLRGGAPVTVRLQGQNRRGWAEAIEREQAIAAGLLAYLQQVPRLARYYGVTLDPDGQPNVEDVERVAQDKVIVRLRVAPAGAPVTNRAANSEGARERVGPAARE
jgi:deazaflavin-dependent oxidoreductase (nitroreductase family)